MKTNNHLATFFIIGILLISSLGLTAQNRHRHISSEQRDRIESHKIAFLTDKLDLTPSEAEKFWPVYNANRDRIDAERKRFRASIDINRDEIEGMSDEKAKALLQTKLDHEQNMLNLKKEYTEELKKVLSPQKIVRLFDVEKEFREELIRQVSRRKSSGGRE